MKKITLSLLAFVCAITCAFGLAACGGEHTHEWSDAWSSDATHHWHACNGCDETKDKAEHIWNAGEITEQATAEHDGIKTFTCTVTGCQKTKTESVKYAPKYTVSADEWNEVLENITNYTVNISINNAIIETDKLDEWKVIFIAPENEAYDIMLTKEEEKYYQYEKHNGNWTREECDGNDDDINIHAYRKLFSGFRNTFNSFTYSEEDKQYVCAALNISENSMLLPLEITNIKVKFENGALVSFIFDVDMDGDTATYEYGSFGTTQVDLPQVGE